MPDKIEALVDAIAARNGWGRPTSDSYKLRNPLLLLSFSKPGKNEVDKEGRRIFESRLAGYHAACFDVGVKLSGKSKAGLKENDKLSDLLTTYGVTGWLSRRASLKFIRQALVRPEIKLSTPLSYFSRR
jgi:hypothetical protein